MRVARICIAAALLVAVGAGIAGADIPDPDGNVYACYLKARHAPLPKGNLRAIDNDQGGNCSSKENFVALKPGTVVVSDRAAKSDIHAIDDAKVLEAVGQLPVSSWRYKSGGSRHIGPMAQDFTRLFGVGPDAKHIDLIDASGVSLAAIKSLDGTVHKQQREIAILGALFLATLSLLVLQRLRGQRSPRS